MLYDIMIFDICINHLRQNYSMFNDFAPISVFHQTYLSSKPPRISERLIVEKTSSLMASGLHQSSAFISEAHDCMMVYLAHCQLSIPKVYKLLFGNSIVDDAIQITQAKFPITQSPQGRLIQPVYAVL